MRKSRFKEDGSDALRAHVAIHDWRTCSSMSLCTSVCTLHWKWRAVVCVLLAAGTLALDLTYIPADLPPVYPPITVINHTWWGAPLWSLVPLSLLWLSLGFKSRGLKIAGVAIALFVGVYVSIMIYWQLNTFGRTGCGW